MIFQTAYGDKESPVVDCGGLEKSRTKQSQSDECDINKLMAKYQHTGQLTHINRSIASYGDFSTTDDYLSASLKLMAADRAFAELPAPIRAKFANNPKNFVAFVEDGDNYEEAFKMGLIDPEAIPVPRTQPPEEIPPEPPPEEESSGEN